MMQMVSSFALTNVIFRNADRVREENEVIDFAPLAELRKESNQWYRLVNDLDDSHVRQLATALWRLVTSVHLTLLPFDEAGLLLREQLDAVSELASTIPELRTRRPVLRGLVAYLLEHPHNPKRARVLERLEGHSLAADVVGLVSSLSRWPLPGSGLGTDEVPASIVPISSRSILMARTYDAVLVPGSTRNCPFSRELFHAARARRIQFIRFSSESGYRPARPTLPTGSQTSVVQNRIREKDDLNAGDVAHVLETRVDIMFWEQLRALSRAPEGDAPSSAQDRQHFVRARLVLFRNDCWTNLREDQKVLEISRWIDGVEDLPPLRRFPRREVSALEEGHLVVLRTAGSGDYLVDVADGLLKADGRDGLRRSSTDWKALLASALTEHGSREIARRFASCGHRLSSPSYLWIWTTNHVMRPESRDAFLALMRVLAEVGFSLDDSDPEVSARERWSGMADVIRYHYRAAAVIRRALLKRLRRIIAEGQYIDTEYQLSLEGVDAGELSVLRIAAVDDQVRMVPYGASGILEKIK